MVGGKKKRNPEVTPKQEQIKFEEELNRKMKLQLKRDELAKKNQDEGSYQASTNSVQTKLLELVITKFDGSYIYILWTWPRFWGQFSETTDKTSVTPITKFTYLRELVDKKVGRTIEALPFTTKDITVQKAFCNRGLARNTKLSRPTPKKYWNYQQRQAQTLTKSTSSV